MHKGLGTLDQLPIGSSAVVHHVGCDRPVARRLMDTVASKADLGAKFGMTDFVNANDVDPIEAVRRAPLGDPLEIRLRGYLLSLRLADAALIQLVPEGRADLVDQPGNAPTFQFAAHPALADRPAARVPKVLLAGNANSGKTTIFNALTGARAQVSNYPGVTVTRSSRRITLPSGAPVEVVDLPGTYSLSANAPDEQVAANEVLGHRGDPPDAVVVVVDAGAVERGLYLVLQIVETGVPVVVVLNMIDEASAGGIDFDVDRLSQWLGATVVSTVASRGHGLDDVRRAIDTALTRAPRADAAWPGLSDRTEEDVAAG